MMNWDTVAPASRALGGLFYAAGIVFGVSSCVIMVHELYRLLTGQVADADLIAVSESEELQHSIPDAATESSSMTVAVFLSRCSAPWRSACRSRLR